MAGLNRAIGVFGGSFDPPHLAHLVLAEEARHQLGLERVLWVLTPDNPLKPGMPITPLQDRIDLLEAAIAPEPAFELSRIDIDRVPPHYSYETVLLLGESNLGAGMVFLMGEDSLTDLPHWKEPLELISVVQALGVMRRLGANVDLASLEEQLPGLSRKVRFFDTPLLEISASDIRRRIASGTPFRYFLPEAVYRIIVERGLYGSGPEER
jgi:nicotinate-nucleotide adenylyltransferase